MPEHVIPVGISNRHFHISQRDLEILYGTGHQLQVYKNILQKGQFAAKETIDVIGPKGELKGIRIVGPTRDKTQLEICHTDAYILGIAPPVRYSGDLSGTPGAKLRGPAGEIDLREGIIIPQRHIHMNPSDAGKLGVREGDRVFVAPVSNDAADPVNEPRTIIFGNVLIRIDDSFVLEFHLDRDEANASGLKTGDQVFIVRKDKKVQPVRNKRLITENDVRKAIMQKQKIIVPPGTIVTPAARDLAKEHHIFDD